MSNKQNIERCSSVIVTTNDNKVFLQERDDIPNIDFPGYWSFISGPPKNLETPIEGILRELREEIVLSTGEFIRFGTLTFLGSDERSGLNRTEYVFHIKLLTDPSLVHITEGKGFRLFNLNDCFNLEKLAPHHKQYLLKYQNKIIKIIEEQSNMLEEQKKIPDKQTIHDYVQILDLGSMKDLESLERGRGFVVVDGDKISALIHTEVDVAFIGHVEFLPDTPRGNHYHQRKIEYMVILRGNLKAHYELINAPNEVWDTILRTGQLVRILPGCIHTYTAIGEKVITIEFSPQKYISSDVLYRENK